MVEFDNKILKFLNSECIPSTVMLEQISVDGKFGTNVYSHKGNVVLSGPSITDMANLQLQTPEEIQDAGEQYFDVCEISPYIPIKFVNEVVPHPFTPKIYL